MYPTQNNNKRKKEREMKRKKKFEIRYTGAHL
jgi:hypothetical protein